jgi:hypothetical protein
MDTLKECTEKRPSEKMRIIANTFLTHWLKGKCEALCCPAEVVTAKSWP